MKMTEVLFDDIINTAQDCVFWKDKERRFVGVNQAFLDYYGFASADVLIGKTDEDMGWHNDPDPFMQDELKVLQGESTYKVHGKCIIKGEERDIIASKRPIYDGKEIVGLVGSFVDVTEVLRLKEGLISSQTVYTEEQLRKYHYFDKILDEIPLLQLVDPLTGALSRGYMLDFVKYLIANEKPFTFSIIDLDNFKFINDSHGHAAGDAVLMDVTKELAAYVRGYGLVGRFGGDELLLLNFRDQVFYEKKNFFEELFTSNKVFRKIFRYEDCSLFITATVGCATFPLDADNYTDLFTFIDKTLYRGKSKGRNCYVIYNPEIHKDMDIKKLTRHGLHAGMKMITEMVDSANGFRARLKAVMPFLKEELQIQDMYYVGPNRKMRALYDDEFSEDVSDIENLIDDDMYFDHVGENMKVTSPKLYDAFSNHLMHSVLITRIGTEDDIRGYLICAGTRSQRIWQENERAFFYFLSRLIYDSLRTDDEEISD